MLYLRRSRLSHLALLAFLVALGLASSGQAATITAPLSSTFGYPLTGSVTIDDGIDPGNLVITAQIDAQRGSVRGLLAHVADESLLDGLSIVGAGRRAYRFDANDVGKAAKSRGLGRPGSACPCDFGIRFSAREGTSVTFTLTHDTEALTIALFYGQAVSLQASNIRVDDGYRRNGKSRSKGIRKAVLEGTFPTPVPEPTTALLMGLGLAGLAYTGRRPQA
ncbi:MAG: PEP-CTERM sorting domain-containing protein [Myxococcota bacterium]